jgi:hypothetical protein
MCMLRHALAEVRINLGEWTWVDAVGLELPVHDVPRPVRKAVEPRRDRSSRSNVLHRQRNRTSQES